MYVYIIMFLHPSRHDSTFDGLCPAFSTRRSVGNALVAAAVSPDHFPQAVIVGLGLEGRGVVEAAAVDALIVRALADGGAGLGVDHERGHHAVVFVEEQVAVLHGHSREVQIFGSEHDVFTGIDVHHVVGAWGGVGGQGNVDFSTPAYNDSHSPSSYRWP